MKTEQLFFEKFKIILQRFFYALIIMILFAAIIISLRL